MGDRWSTVKSVVPVGQKEKTLSLMAICGEATLAQGNILQQSQDPSSSRNLPMECVSRECSPVRLDRRHLSPIGDPRGETGK